MFDKKGYIVVEKAKADEDTLMAAALDAGADDMRDDGDSWEIMSAPDAFQKVLEAVKALGIEPGGRRARVPAAELRQARRQAGAADGQADGSARGARRHQEGVVERRHRREGDRGLVGVKIFGIDPGSERTGYGCVERSGSRHHLVTLRLSRGARLGHVSRTLQHIHAGLVALLAECRPDCVAVESIFHARNVRSALKLGHARGVALLAASEAGLCVVEYAPAEIKRAVVGYGRAEKPQVQQMVKLLLGLDAAPSPHDAADALAVAICHLHNSTGGRSPTPSPPARTGRAAAAAHRWREYRPVVIARLAGTLAEKSTGPLDRRRAGRRLRRAGAALHVLRRRRAGRDVTLRVHTHVREDVIALFGFATALEQELFERLISISGIGPKLALAVLSGIEPPDLVRAIRRRTSRGSPRSRASARRRRSGSASS